MAIDEVADHVGCEAIGNRHRCACPHMAPLGVGGSDGRAGGGDRQGPQEAPCDSASLPASILACMPPLRAHVPRLSSAAAWGPAQYLPTVPPTSPTSTDMLGSKVDSSAAVSESGGALMQQGGGEAQKGASGHHNRCTA